MLRWLRSQTQSAAMAPCRLVYLRWPDLHALPRKIQTEQIDQTVQTDQIDQTDSTDRTGPSEIELTAQTEPTDPNGIGQQKHHEIEIWISARMKIQVLRLEWALLEISSSATCRSQNIICTPTVISTLASTV